MRRTRRGPRLRSLALGLLILPLAAASSGRAQDSWDAVYLSGTKIGHVHTFIEKVSDRGRDLLRVRVDMELQFKRLKDSIKLETRYGTIETPTGEVLRIDTRTVASRQEMRTSGSVKDGQMTLTMEGGGQKQVVTIPWSPEVRGPYAAEQSLSRSPIKPGESRDLLMYIPDLNKVCDTKLTARSPEDVLLGDGKRSLLRVEQVVSLQGKVLPECGATLWVDSGGQVLKSRTDLLGGMESYRTTEAGAKAGSNKVPEFNLIAASIIKIGNKIDKPEARRDIVYRVTLKDDDPSKVIPRDRRQTIRSESGKNTAILEVKTAGPTEGPPGPETVGDEYLRPNALVTSRDPNVVRLAQQAVAGATNPWDKAVRIEHWVAEKLVNKNFETAFAPASEVAETLSGDCTEHSVLAAAMCRAQGIPSRVAVGLVYAHDLGGFGFHMWNEVYVNQRWVALDSAFDQSSVDAVHIKLSETSLDGVAPYEAFMPVLRVMGKMDLQPLEIR